MAKLSKTSKPGIFRRHVKECSGKGRCDCPYVIVWRSLGRQYTETHRTMALAQEAKRRHEAEVSEGAFAEGGPRRDLDLRELVEVAPHRRHPAADEGRLAAR